ncbi:MAG: prepilin-type N-terminal cleavage/methylation domain-containing protein [Candidatus Thiodiazotropha sp. (ex Gloverina cf. vestifex)]|nr:prepilin-type N-terminal cleavage/methylation domain-containing protein [Candidatus Thiodiazotropha sp. (ex Gloverina cf. vestifex)]
MRKYSAGLTLVELMVTLAVLAIIVSIGYPMYTAQVQKSRRADARAGVMELAMAQEREFAAWGGYSEANAAITGITFADSAPAPDANSTFVADVTRIANQYNQFYSFNIQADNNAFIITGTPTGRQAGDAACATFSVDQTGTKAATDGNLCW